MPRYIRINTLYLGCDGTYTWSTEHAYVVSSDRSASVCKGKGKVGYNF